MIKKAMDFMSKTAFGLLGANMSEPRKKAQTAFEFTILIVIVLGALLTIQVYFKRGLQGRWKATVDDLGDQYDPRTQRTNVVYGIKTNSLTRITSIEDAVERGRWTSRFDEGNTLETRSGFSSAPPP